MLESLTTKFHAHDNVDISDPDTFEFSLCFWIVPLFIRIISILLLVYNYSYN